MYQKKFLLSALAVALLPGLSVQQAVAKDSELLVTASKQSQYAASSQNVASHVVSSSQLEDANITNTKELSKVLPGVNIGRADSVLFPLISVRGSSSAQDYYNTAVTLYIDGVPQPSVGFVQPLGDIERVELLKGPQGTLYGKTAQGGIINIVTKKPAADYQGYISGGYASRDGYRGKFAINGPLAEGLLYAGISGLRDVSPGRLTNPANGHKNLGGSSDNLGSVNFRLAPDNQPWEIAASYTASCMDTSQSLAVSLVNVNSSIGQVFGDAPDPSIHRCIRNQVISGKYQTDSWLFSAVSSWEQLNWSRTFAIPWDSRPYKPLRLISQPEKWLQDMQEIRAATQGENNVLDAVAGIYRQNIRQQKNMLQQENYQGEFVGGKDYARTQMQTLAVYTDLTWHINSAWDVGAGVRVSHDSASTSYINNTDLAQRKGDVNRNHLLGQLSAGYQLTEQNRLYARIAQGYKSVGFDYHPNFDLDEPRPYKAENSISYEIGNKYHSQSLDIQLAAFYTSNQDVQMYQSRADNPAVSALSNLGDTHALGMEVAGSWHFLPGWVMGANLNLTRARFTNDSKNIANEMYNITYAGKRVPSVPNYSGGVYLSGNIDTALGMVTPWIGVNAMGTYSFDDNDYEQSAYSTTDLRIGWQATDRINLSAYVNNVFDKHYFTYAYMPADYGYTNIGRTAGVDLKIDLF